MKIHTEKQGEPGWHALRAKFDTASQAQAMMGQSGYQTRNELLAEKKSGKPKPVTKAQQYIFDKGHAAEASARPIIEARIGEELYPVVVSDGTLLASLDGATMGGELNFEHKLWNAALADLVSAGEVPETHYWQLEQQMLVSGAACTLFVVSDGTEENMAVCEYRPVPGRAEKLIAGWKQFNADLETFVVPVDAPVLEGKVMDALPAISIELSGMVTYSNLAEFEASVTQAISAVKSELVTDQDFADAKLSIKWCTEAEALLKTAKTAALSKTADLAELFATIDRLTAFAAKTRLATEKQVKAQDAKVRQSIDDEAYDALLEHHNGLNRQLGTVKLPWVNPEFAAQMKGKRNLESMRNAVATELARLKIEANALFGHIVKSLDMLFDACPNLTWFPDVQRLALLDHESLGEIIKARAATNAAEVAAAAAAVVAAAEAAAVTPEPAPAPTPAPAPAPAVERQAQAPVRAPQTRRITVVLEGIAVAASIGMHALGGTVVEVHTATLTQGEAA